MEDGGEAHIRHLPSLSDEQRMLDGTLRKCHCSQLEQLMFAPLTLSPWVLLATHGHGQTPGAADGVMLQGKEGCCG